MKGQSAIEYLATYGWMILAVSIVAGLAYTNIQTSCTRSSSDFYTDAISINDFGLDGEGNLLISVENSRYEEISFKSVNVTVDDEFVYEDLDFNLTSSEQSQISIPGFQSTRGCNTLQVGINFDRGNLTDQEVTGIIRAPIGFE